MPPFLADVLTWPGNRIYITAIKAAINFSVPPTVMLLNDRQPDKWLPVDKKLAIAYQILEEETCPDCGTPIWLGHSDDETVTFSIKSTTCYSCAVIEAEQDNQSKRKRAPAKGTKKNLAFEPDEGIRQPSRKVFFERLAGIISKDN